MQRSSQPSVSSLRLISSVPSGPPSSGTLAVLSLSSQRHFGCAWPGASRVQANTLCFQVDMAAYRRRRSEVGTASRRTAVVGMFPDAGQCQYCIKHNGTTHLRLFGCYSFDFSGPLPLRAARDIVRRFGVRTMQLQNGLALVHTAPLSKRCRRRRRWCRAWRARFGHFGGGQPHRKRWQSGVV